MRRWPRMRMPVGLILGTIFWQPYWTKFKCPGRLITMKPLSRLDLCYLRHGYSTALRTKQNWQSWCEINKIIIKISYAAHEYQTLHNKIIFPINSFCNKWFQIDILQFWIFEVGLFHSSWKLVVRLELVWSVYFYHQAWKEWILNFCPEEKTSEQLRHITREPL